MQPRLIRIRDIPHYLGMDINRFNKEVRPSLVAIPIGKQGIAFDRLDLDEWVEQYKHRNGHPAISRRNLWVDKKSPDYNYAMGSGLSTKKSSENEFAKVLAHIRSMEHKNT